MQKILYNSDKLAEINYKEKDAFKKLGIIT